MNVDLYEKIWMYGVAVMLALFFGSTAMAAIGRNIHPPSHVETIDPKTALADPRFAKQGVTRGLDGKVDASVVGMMFVWLRAEATIPADTPVTFRTNGQVMVVPGYVSQFTVSLPVGEYLVACNEYCGIGHHTMAGKLHVVPKEQWTPFPEVAK